MTQEQAAKYLVVAWVKGWTMSQYFFTVCEAKIGSHMEFKYEDANKLFNWLPEDPFVFLRKMTVRRYIADNHRLLNEKIWDAKDNEGRLKLYSTILKWNGKSAGAKINSMRKEVMDESKKSSKEFQANRMVYHNSVSAMRKGSGHAWNVCK